MGTVQTAYTDVMRLGLAGMIANAELQNVITRSLLSGALGFGQPVQQSGDHSCLAADELTMTPVGANGVPPPAGATIGSLTAAPPAYGGVYNIVCTVGGAATASRWRVEDPDGRYIGTALGNTAFAASGIGFTITDAGTDPVPGEQFNVTVTAEADGRFLGISVRDPSLEPISSVDTYKQYDNVAVMTKGVIFVTAGAGGATAGQPVFWDEVTSKFVMTNTDYPIPGGFFDSSGVDGDIVKLALR